MAQAGFTDDLKRNVLTGVAALFPILITLFLFVWLYHQLDLTIGRGANALCRNVLARNGALFRTFFPNAPADVVADSGQQRAYVEENFPRAIGSLLGVAGVVVLVYLFGKIVRGYLGRRLMGAVDRFFERFPVIKAVYPHARQVGNLLFGGSGRSRFSRVVAVQYPREGIYSLGLVTGEGLEGLQEAAGKPLITIFVPTSPTPLTGFVIAVAAEEVAPMDLTVDEAFRYCITAGMWTKGAPRGHTLQGPSRPAGDGEAAATGVQDGLPTA